MYSNLSVMSTECCRCLNDSDLVGDYFFLTDSHVQIRIMDAVSPPVTKINNKSLLRGHKMLAIVHQGLRKPAPHQR